MKIPICKIIIPILIALVLALSLLYFNTQVPNYSECTSKYNGDTNTGIYHSAADHIDFTTAGVNAGTIHDTGAWTLGAATTILNVVNIILVGIAAISLLIGGIGIANTMYTSVLERTKEIGVMKAIGAKNSDILRVFVIT